MLWEKISRYGIREEIVSSIEILYKETTCIVIMGEKTTRRFWIKKGLRQGAPLSSLLFLIYVADVEQHMKGKGNRGVMLGKILHAGYVMVLMATEKEKKKRMLKRSRKYL